MTRRQLLKTTSLLAAPLLATTSTPVLKGFCANTPELVNTLAPDWAMISFAHSVLDKDYGDARIVILLYDIYWTLNLANLTTMYNNLVASGNYDRWWMVGINEPDLSNTPAQAVADAIISQGNLVLAVDPSARLSIAALAQSRPLFSNSYFWDIWGLLPDNIQRKVRGINLHWYAQSAGLSDTALLTQAPLEDYLSQTRTAMAAHGIGDRQLWLTEVGLSKSPYTEAHLDKIANYPNVVRKACGGGLADRFSIFIQQETPQWASYYCLLDAAGNLTPMGERFKGL